MISAPSSLASTNQPTHAATRPANFQQPSNQALEQRTLGFGEKLPTEILLQITQLLSINDFINLRQTDKASYALTTQILLGLFRPKCGKMLLDLFRSRITYDDPEKLPELKKLPGLLVQQLYKLISGKQAREAFKSQRVKISLKPVKKYSLDFQVCEAASRARSRKHNFESESDKNTFQQHRLFQELISHAFLKPLIGFVPKTADIILSGNRELKWQDLKDLNMSQELPVEDLSPLHTLYLFNNLVVISTQPCNPNFKAFGDIPEEELLLGIAETSDDYIRALKFTSGLFYRPVDEFGQPLYDQEALYWAAANNKPERVEEILKAGVSINIMSRQGGSALHGAVANGHKEMSESLIQQGISLESRDENGFTPFLLAARYQSITMVKSLLDICDYMAHDLQQDPTGKDLLKFSRNARNSNYLLQQCTENGDDALYLAVESGDIEKVEYFVKRGLYLEPLEDEASQSKALMLAIQSKKFEIVNYLLKCKGILGWHNGLSLLQEAVYTRNFSMFKLCALNMEDALDTHKQALLESAVAMNDYDILWFLKAWGADLEQPNANNETLLHIAINNGRLSMLKELALHMKDTLNKHKQALLERAVAAGNPSIVRFLIKRDAKLDLPTANNKTLLHVAMDNGRLPMLRFLAAKMENQFNEHKQSLLESAVVMNRGDIVRFLVEQGARLDLPTTNNETLLHVATSNGHLPMLSALALNMENKFNEHKYELLGIAVDIGRIDIVRFLISQNAPLNSAQFLWTPLHLAVRKGYADIVELLVQYQAQKDVFWGMHTPLSLAIRDKDLELVKILVRYGALVDIVHGKDNMHFMTPLDMAVENGSVDIFNTLIAGPKFDASCSPQNLALLEKAYNYGQEYGDHTMATNLIAQLSGKESMALHAAILQQNKRAVNILLRYDFDWQNNSILPGLIELAQELAQEAAQKIGQKAAQKAAAILQRLLNASVLGAGVSASDLAEDELGSDISLSELGSDDEWED